MENTCFSFLKNSITEHEDVPLSFFFLVISQPLVALSFLIYNQSLFSGCTQGIFLAFSRFDYVWYICRNDCSYSSYLGLLRFLDLQVNILYQIWDVFIHYFFKKNYSVPFLLFLLSFCYILLYIHVELNFIYFELPDIVLLVSETKFFFSRFTLCFLDWIVLLVYLQAHQFFLLPSLITSFWWIFILVLFFY